MAVYVTGDTHGDWMSRLKTSSFPEQKEDASNRSIYNRPIKKWVSTEVGCVKERPHIL